MLLLYYIHDQTNIIQIHCSHDIPIRLFATVSDINISFKHKILMRMYFYIYRTIRIFYKCFKI